MDRRRFLGALGSSVALAGCLEGVGSKEIDHEAYVFYYLQEKPVIEGGIDIDQVDSRNRTLFAFRSASAATERVDFAYLEELGAGNAESFVRNTDYETGILVVYQEFPVARSPKRSIVRSQWDEGTVRLMVGDSGMGSSASAIETMFVRVKLDGYDAPETIEMTNGVDWSIETDVP